MKKHFSSFPSSQQKNLTAEGKNFFSLPPINILHKNILFGKKFIEQKSDNWGQNG